jgi:hypothetical protein
MRYPIAILAGLGTATLSTPSAACTPEFTTSTESVNIIGAAVGTGNVSTQSVVIGVRNGGGEACTVFLRVSRLRTAASDLPPYALTISGRPVTISPDATVVTGDSDVPTAVAGDAGTDPIRVEVRVPTEWGLVAGDYSDQLVLSLLNNNGTIVDQLDLSVRISIPAVTDLRVVGATGGGSGPALIDLGTLSTTGVTQSPPFGIRVWSTSSYSVEFLSTNNGTLLHVNGIDRIPYLFSVDGRDVDLAAGLRPVTFSRHTSSLGDYHFLGILVPPVGAARAGTYYDEIRITISTI